MPQGYSDAMRVFNKLLKPPFSYLRTRGFISVIYVDDSLLIGFTFDECITNVLRTIELLRSLGFYINVKKSTFYPSQRIIFLGFTICSRSMSVALTLEKKEVILQFALMLLASSSISIRVLASFIGRVVASLPGVTYGRAFYRDMEFQKIDSLKYNKGNFDAYISLNTDSLSEIAWWRDNIMQSWASISPIPISIYVKSDASSRGWGVFVEGIAASFGGRWSIDDQNHYINYLELLALQYALFSIYRPSFKHIRLVSDNTTAISYINNQGGKVRILNSLAKKIWTFAFQNNIWISASQNIHTYFNSRNFNDNLEWSLNQDVFHFLTDRFGMPQIDLFASILNHKISPYMSYHHDPESIAIDAFSVSWVSKYAYAFPPFSLVFPTLRKISFEECTVLIITPVWTTQPWFPKLLHLLIDFPIVFSSNHLHLPGTDLKHPMSPKLKMMAAKLSSDSSLLKNFHHQLLSLSCNLGENPQPHRTTRPGINGQFFAREGLLIPYTQL